LGLLVDEGGTREKTSTIRDNRGSQSSGGDDRRTSYTLPPSQNALTSPLRILRGIAQYGSTASENSGVLNGGKFDLAVYAWISGSDPDDWSQWACNMIPPAGNNIARYCSPEMDAAQRLALSTFDRAARKRAYSQIQSLLSRDAPTAFVYYQSLRYAHASDLCGPFGYTTLRENRRTF
jgi:ABC-type transport system substrate-binding protein